jgi:hypothetical protein
MKIGKLACASTALLLVLAFGVVASADTIRMKDGQVIRGQIVAFRDQQFTILLPPGSRGRRSRMTVYIEDVESVEFDAATATIETGGGGGDDASVATPSRTQSEPTSSNPPPVETRPTLERDSGAPTSARTNPGTQPNSAGNSRLIPIKVRVRADATSNGWTDSGLMVRRGQRLRISAEGRVSLGQGRYSTPTGLPRIVDTEKLMRDKPTGGLIAVIGDDNDEFIFVGSSYEFHATRDGRLFLGVNEGNLKDNAGTFDALIEVEPVTSGGK